MPQKIIQLSKEPKDINRVLDEELKFARKQEKNDFEWVNECLAISLHKINEGYVIRIKYIDIDSAKAEKIEERIRRYEK